MPSLWADLLGLLYPRLCAGCSNNLPRTENPLCLQCHSDLPRTGFAPFPDNPVEKIFSGRIRLEAAHSEYYFSKNPLIRNLIHRLKYKGSQETGLFLGRLLGESLTASGRFEDIDMIIPLPLYPDKQYRRGYNQAEVIARGIRESFPVELITEAVTRTRNTATQTRKHRMDRWLNVNGGFMVKNPESFAGLHILLVDDVITTGASLEACANALLAVPGVRLSIASLAMASK